MTMTEVKYASEVIFTKTPHILPSQVSYWVSFVRIWVKIDRIIMELLCILSGNIHFRTICQNVSFVWNQVQNGNIKSSHFCWNNHESNPCVQIMIISIDNFSHSWWYTELFIYHFMNGKASEGCLRYFHCPKVINFISFQCIIICLLFLVLTNFAHVMTAVLSWRVQTFVKMEFEWFIPDGHISLGNKPWLLYEQGPYPWPACFIMVNFSQSRVDQQGRCDWIFVMVRC